MNWISVKVALPASGRYLVFSKCEKGVHKALAWNWDNPCCNVNIAYYQSHINQWEYGTRNPVPKDVKITHWMPLPNPPEQPQNAPASTPNPPSQETSPSV